MLAVDYFDKIMKIEDKVVKANNKSNSLKNELYDIISKSADDKEISSSEFEELYSYQQLVLSRF